MEPAAVSEKKTPTKMMVRCVDCGKRVAQDQAYNMASGTPGWVCGPCVVERVRKQKDYEKKAV